MNCKVVQELLSAYIDCELACEEEASIRAHLEECPCCCEEECQMRLLKLLIASAPCAEPPPGFEDRLFQTVLDLDEDKAVLRKPKKESIMAFSGVVLMAASLTMLALNFMSMPTDTAERDAAFAFEVRRDQATFAGADPFAGSPTVVPTHYAGN